MVDDRLGEVRAADGLARGAAGVEPRLVEL
jgi:hypothetical protein